MAVAERVARDHHIAAARQFHIVHILHLKVVLAAVLRDDKRELVVRAGRLGDKYPRIQV